MLKAKKYFKVMVLIRKNFRASLCCDFKLKWKKKRLEYPNWAFNQQDLLTHSFIVCRIWRRSVLRNCLMKWSKTGNCSYNRKCYSCPAHDGRRSTPYIQYTSEDTRNWIRDSFKKLLHRELQRKKLLFRLIPHDLLKFQKSDRTRINM